MRMRTVPFLLWAVVRLLWSTEAFEVTLPTKKNFLLLLERGTHKAHSLHASSVKEEEANSASTSHLVSATVERVMPHVSPTEAKNVWLEHQWRRGGGLPVWVKALSSGERILLPIGMKEKLLESNTQDPLVIRYVVTDPGPVLGQHMIAGSHSAQVDFAPEGPKGCLMTWTSEFKVKQWAGFYSTLTETAFGIAANTVAEAAAVPRLFTLTATLSEKVSPDHAAREWLDFLWGKGGGLPLPPAIPYGEKIPGMDESSPARTSLLRVPPYLNDTIKSVQWARNHLTDKVAGVCYGIENCGWATIPFLIHTHAGRVRFTESITDNELKMRWDIQTRSFPLMRPVVEKLIEMAASTISRNLQVRLAQPGAMVKIAPPRGGTKLGEISRDTWVGGVLAAHLTDTRSTLDQTVSLLQPWTWGRSGCGDDNDTVHFKWSDGEMPS